MADPIDPGLAQALDSFTVPALDSGFADRMILRVLAEPVAAGPTASAAPLPRLRARRSRVFRAAASGAGVLAAGLLSISAAAAGLLGEPINHAIHQLPVVGKVIERVIPEHRRRHLLTRDHEDRAHEGRSHEDREHEVGREHHRLTRPPPTQAAGAALPAAANPGQGWSHRVEMRGPAPFLAGHRLIGPAPDAASSPFQLPPSQRFASGYRAATMRQSHRLGLAQPLQGERIAPRQPWQGGAWRQRGWGRGERGYGAARGMGRRFGRDRLFRQRRGGGFGMPHGGGWFGPGGGWRGGMRGRGMRMRPGRR